MKCNSLTLTGFCGIRDGLGRDSLTLDFDSLVGNAPLVALVGGNGRGKTTVLDNMHPYPVMPSRASEDGLGSFSYYDQIYLPESQKILEWEMDGQRYRSHLVFRLNGKRKTEAFLHVRQGDKWSAAKLEDGTESDGKMDTYARCVERILGSSDTFFTTSFSAQGRRQLSKYRNAEIKVLLGDLLGLERIRLLGAKAADTVRLLKAGLNGMRGERERLDKELAGARRELAALGDPARRLSDAGSLRDKRKVDVDAAKETVLKLTMARDAAREQDARRAHLITDRQNIIDGGRAALAALDAQDEREAARLRQLDLRVEQRARVREAGRKRLLEQRQKMTKVVDGGRHVERAVRQQARMKPLVETRLQTAAAKRADAALLEQLGARMRLVTQKIAGVEREAGQAALRVEELRQRHRLATEVPCSGTDLQARCQLLGDAREAKQVMPSAALEVGRLANEHVALEADLHALRVRTAALGGADAALQNAERKLNLSRARLQWESQLAARKEEVRRAVEALAEVEAQLAALEPADAGDSVDEAAERTGIAVAREQIRTKRAGESASRRQALNRVDEMIAAIPAPFDTAALSRAQATERAALTAVAAAEQAYETALGDRHRLTDVRLRLASLDEDLRECDNRRTRLESTLGDWALFTKCLGNDGLIALEIDDAGPELAALTNDLLRACYGQRFTVTLITQTETAQGELREDFDILVHDAWSDSRKSLARMSGGERVWINEGLTKAMALYLARGSARHSATLFSDEADGAFDPVHKRMFIDMKREVLRIGGYQQEFFISHTPELTDLADAVIDLDDQVAPAFGGSEHPAPAGALVSA